MEPRRNCGVCSKDGVSNLNRHWTVYNDFAHYGGFLVCFRCHQLYECAFCKKNLRDCLERKQSSDNLVCTVGPCGMALSTPEKWERHERLTHSKIFKVDCGICGKQFKDKSSLEPHFCNCHKNQPVAHRDISVPIPPKKKPRLAPATREIFKCYVQPCNAEFASVVHLQSHVNDVHQQASREEVRSKQIAAYKTGKSYFKRAIADSDNFKDFMERLLAMQAADLRITKQPKRIGEFLGAGVMLLNLHCRIEERITADVQKQGLSDSSLPPTGALNERVSEILQFFKRELRVVWLLNKGWRKAERPKRHKVRRARAARTSSRLSHHSNRPGPSATAAVTKRPATNSEVQAVHPDQAAESLADPSGNNISLFDEQTMESSAYDERDKPKQIGNDDAPVLVSGATPILPQFSQESANDLDFVDNQFQATNSAVAIMSETIAHEPSLSESNSNNTVLSTFQAFQVGDDDAISFERNNESFKIIPLPENSASATQNHQQAQQEHDVSGQTDTINTSVDFLQDEKNLITASYPPTFCGTERDEGATSPADVKIETLTESILDSHSQQITADQVSPTICLDADINSNSSVELQPLQESAHACAEQCTQTDFNEISHGESQSSADVHSNPSDTEGPFESSEQLELSNPEAANDHGKAEVAELPCHTIATNADANARGKHRLPLLSAVPCSDSPAERKCSLIRCFNCLFEGHVAERCTKGPRSSVRVSLNGILIPMTIDRSYPQSFIDYLSWRQLPPTPRAKMSLEKCREASYLYKGFHVCGRTRIYVTFEDAIWSMSLLVVRSQMPQTVIGENWVRLFCDR